MSPRRLSQLDRARHSLVEPPDGGVWLTKHEVERVLSVIDRLELGARKALVQLAAADASAPVENAQAFLRHGLQTGEEVDDADAA